MKTITVILMLGSITASAETIQCQKWVDGRPVQGELMTQDVSGIKVGDVNGKVVAYETSNILEPKASPLHVQARVVDHGMGARISSLSVGFDGPSIMSAQAAIFDGGSTQVGTRLDNTEHSVSVICTIRR